MNEERVLCPNCGAYGLSVKDHDTGEPSPDRWRCDNRRAMDRQPNYLLTWEAAKTIQVILVNSGQLKLAAILND
jgi:hypothetical protein